MFLSLVLISTTAVVSKGGTALPLVMLTDAQSKDKGAVCLDGTNPGMYVGKSNSSENGNKFVLYFKGKRNMMSAFKELMCSALNALCNSGTRL